MTDMKLNPRHEITIRQGERSLSGRFEGIDPQGRLQLAGDQGLTLVDAGDLYFRS